MAYIEVRTTLPDHKKAKAMARDVGMRRPWVVGHLVCIWTWALENVPSNGSLAGIEDVDLEEAAQWPEERAGELVPAMVRAGFIEADRTGRFIHDWDEYAGRLLRRREEDRTRKAAERAAARAAGSPAACPACGRSDIVERGRVRTHYRREQLADAKWRKIRCEGSGQAVAATRGRRGVSDGPADSAARPMDTRQRPQDNPPQSATPRVPAGARPRRRTAPHRTVSSTEPEEVPFAGASRRRKRPPAGGDPPPFDPTQRPDLAALTERGWRFSQAQADSLAEVASFERLRDADHLSGFAAVAGWIVTAPKSGDLLEHVFATSTRLRRERVAKASPPVNGSAKPIDHATAIAKLREFRGRVSAEQWTALLERYAVTEAELDVDEIDWTPPGPGGQGAAP